MTVRRGLLYTGVFLLATGGVVLLAQAGAIDSEAVTRALSLWPLAIIAIGIGLMVRRTRAGLAGGLIAAAMPGLLFGGMIVAVPDLSDFEGWSGTCGGASRTEAVTERHGSFGAAAKVDLSLACGELVLTTGDGSTWQFDAAKGRRDGAVVSDSTDSRSIPSAARPRSFSSLDRGEDWRLRLPTGTLLDLRAEISAGEARLDLAGARIGNLDLALNAGKARLDAAGATVSRLDVEVNAGAATVLLPGSDVTGALAVNAGSLKVCAPAGLGLHVRGEASLGSTTFNGLVRVGDAWESPDYATKPFHADLTVEANVGSVVINPEGGCL